MKSTTEPRLEEWRALLEKELTRIDRDPKPRFTFHLGWAESYDALFRSEFSEQSEVTALMKIALDSGRVILHARGGAGKTVLLWRLVREALDKNVLPVVVELRKWTAQDYEDWPCQEGVLARLDFLLERFATPHINRLLLDSLPVTSKLVCFDGLNEILWRTAHEILEVAEDLATRIPSLGVVVTDRLVRRHLRRSADWRIATLLPLDPDEVSRHLTKSRPSALIAANHSSLLLLRTPYFLDVALKGDEGATEAAIHEEWFQRHASLNQGDLDRLAGVAFDIYVKDRSRTFEASSFRNIVGDEIVDKLTAAGALTTVQDRSSFTHHLKHDYLAARFLSEHQELWNERVFDQVTFQASSFDALAMTVEMLRSSPEADDFVRRVYDWNYYGAAYVAAQSRRLNERLVSQEMETIVLAMLTEKRWDIVIPTRERVNDALELFGEKGQQFLRITTREELFNILNQVNSSNDTFLRWRKIFETPEQSPITDAELRLVLEIDGLIGWTAANVLRRRTPNPSQLGWLRSCLRSESPTVRWRIVHVLGAFPAQDNALSLLGVLAADSYELARYGAIRSLVEMAARSDQGLRETIFDSLAQKAGEIVESERIVQELERAIFIDKDRAPAGWSESVTKLLSTLRRKETTVEGWDHWERVAYRVNEAFGR